MKRWISLLLVTTTLYAQSEKSVVGTLDKVDLLSEALITDDGHNFGERYFVKNNNNIPMRVTIELVQVINAKNTLPKYTIIVKPGETIELGTVEQDERERQTNWNYEWKVEPDRK